MNDISVRISSSRLKHLEYIEKNMDQIVADAVAQRLKSEQKQRAPKCVAEDMFVSPSTSISSITSVVHR